ncbi:MAG: hypothetical protein V3T08_09855 [Gemmatimonadota bacterium]
MATRKSPARFQRQSDLRALKEADEVRSDSGRMREALEQRRALERISKK